MADQTNDTERKIREQDKNVRQRQHDTTGEQRPEFQKGSPSEGIEQTDSPSGAAGQGAGTVGTVGGQGDNEYGAQRAGSEQPESTLGERIGQQEPLGAGHQHGADGGSVTAAGSGSTGPGEGQAGTDRSRGFIGSRDEESSESEQDRDPQQAGFAEQGRGAPEEGRDIERGRERNANRSTDVEGSSER